MNNQEIDRKDDKKNKLPSAVCVCVDRMQLGFLGAFGNTWIRTPNFDDLAARSVLFDRFYASTLDLTAIYDSIWGDLPEKLSATGYRTILLSDDPAVGHHSCAGGFSELVLIDEPTPVVPPRLSEETRIYKIFANAVELLEEAEQPFFLWVHLRGFGGPWDFPYKYRLEYREEDDPEPYGGTSMPWIDRRGVADPDPDELRSVLETYAGGIRLLDEAVGGFMQAIEIGPHKNERPLFMFGATRGFPMGEHGIIGLDESKVGPGDLFWGENLHLPLLFNFPESEFASVRSDVLAVPGDLNSTLREWFGVNVAEENVSENVNENENESECDVMSLFPAIREDENFVGRKRITSIAENVRAVITPDWFLRVIPEKAGDRYELFAKPDDRYEVNEVASRCEEELEKLLAGEDF